MARAPDGQIQPGAQDGCREREGSRTVLKGRLAVARTIRQPDRHRRGSAIPVIPGLKHCRVAHGTERLAALSLDVVRRAE